MEFDAHACGDAQAHGVRGADAGRDLVVRQDHDSGNPWIFRISPTSEMEAKAFAPLVETLGIKKADLLFTNNDFGIGASQEFGDMLKARRRRGRRPRDDGSEGDRLLRAARQDQGVRRRHAVRDHRGRADHADPQAGEGAALKARIITTGGSNAPDQLIEQAGDAANGSLHLVFFTPWFPEATKNPALATKFVADWKAHGYDVGGLTEGFRGYDGILTIVAAIKAAGKAEPEAIQKALWNVKVQGVNGDIAFIKQGPAGQESAQNVPSVYLVKIENGKVRGCSLPSSRAGRGSGCGRHPSRAENRPRRRAARPPTRIAARSDRSPHAARGGPAAHPPERVPTRSRLATAL